MERITLPPVRLGCCGGTHFYKEQTMAYNPYELVPPEPHETGYYCVSCGEMIHPDEDTWVWDGEYVCDDYCMRDYCRALRVQQVRLEKRIEELVKQITMGMHV